MSWPISLTARNLGLNSVRIHTLQRPLHTLPRRATNTSFPSPPIAKATKTTNTNRRLISTLTKNKSTSCTSVRNLKPPHKPTTAPIRQYSSSAPPPTLHQRVVSRLPARMRPYVERNLRISHITSFLILHELSAIIPLGGLFWVIHYVFPEYVDSLVGGGGFGGNESGNESGEGSEDGWIAKGVDTFNEWVDGAVWRFGKYAERKGYLKDMDAAAAGRVVMELAVSYALVKAVLPLRIMASLWATPWFARVVMGGMGGLMRRMVGKR